MHQVWSLNIKVSQEDWKIWANEEVYKCADSPASMTINDTIACSNLIQHRITRLRKFFAKIENAIENTTYQNHPPAERYTINHHQLGKFFKYSPVQKSWTKLFHKIGKSAVTL